MSIVVSELLLTGIIEVLTTSNEGEVKKHTIDEKIRLCFGTNYR
ncbi:MAG: hypothetical protein WB443_13360 [Nitrososphaeraceae archaeon]